MATKIQELEASMLRFEAELVLTPKNVLRNKEVREKLTELRDALQNKIKQLKKRGKTNETSKS